MTQVDTALYQAKLTQLSRRGVLSLVGGTAVAALLLFMLVRNSLTDDAYITLAYARNVATDLHWGLIPQEVANSATSPLNVILLAIATALTGVSGEVHPVLGLGIVTVGLSMAMAWGWTRIVRAMDLPVVSAVLGLALVLLNPILLSAIGLEVVLIPAVLVLLVAMAAEGRVFWFGVISGLAVLARLDLIVFVLVVAFFTASIRRKLLRAIAGAVVTAGPWYVFSWFALGSAIPDTLVIKTLQEGLFAPWSFVSGPVMYFLGSRLVVPLAFGAALLGVIAVAAWAVLRTATRWEETSQVRRITPAAALGIGGIVYYAVYSFMGVGPYHWYYVTPIVSLSVFLAVAVGAWLASAQREPSLRPGAPTVVLTLVALLGFGNLAADVKQGVPWDAPPIFGNWASATDYARVAKEIGRRVGDKTVASPGEIGTFAYFCDCAIVDEFADRGRVIGKVQFKIDNSNPVTSLALRANYAWLDFTTQPRPIDYEIHYDPGPATGPDSWTVESAAKGVGHFTLLPAR
ncbi:hypothetical protein JOF56_002027 [Kibdelosporangium banguiense]|uniref:Glycosyltransferase RgtA/B/C/D-like domain-containing protein n=1 Tax=Kibdelosporangium banguiense TaxID=1365924 RepID=A0ABS4TB71_9PSEU|nr:hypothetical protein [Kibdelosporangium banguiense]MBP2321642.1 hypothetical protein [Kibdelosporangium banguiense]